MKHPADAAFKIIEDVLHTGSKKHGRTESWRHQGTKFHRMKAIHHLIQAQMIEDGIYPPDGEPHDENALTREAMVLTIKC